MDKGKDSLKWSISYRKSQCRICESPVHTVQKEVLPIKANEELNHLRNFLEAHTTGVLSQISGLKLDVFKYLILLVI